MGMTITEKNMARHAGLDVVKPGQIIECHLDAVLMNDITFPPARKEFLKIGKPVFDRHKIYLVPDHFTPNKDIQSATQAKVMRDFVREHTPGATVIRLFLLISNATLRFILQ